MKAGLNSRKCIWRLKCQKCIWRLVLKCIYPKSIFAKCSPTCVSSKLCKFIFWYGYPAYRTTLQYEKGDLSNSHRDCNIGETTRNAKIFWKSWKTMWNYPPGFKESLAGSISRRLLFVSSTLKLFPKKPKMGVGMSKSKQKIGHICWSWRDESMCFTPSPTPTPPLPTSLCFRAGNPARFTRPWSGVWLLLRRGSGLHSCSGFGTSKKIGFHLAQPKHFQAKHLITHFFAIMLVCRGRWWKHYRCVWADCERLLGCMVTGQAGWWEVFGLGEVGLWICGI